MKFRIVVLFFMFMALLGIAKADHKLYFHLECSPGHPCIDLAHSGGKTESVLASPAQILGPGDVTSASVQSAVNAAPSLNLQLGEEAAGKLEKITAENIGKKLMVVFDNKILIAPTIQAPIQGGRLTIYGDPSRFWERAPWLQDLINGSRRAGGRSVVAYVIIAGAVLIVAFTFVLLPRLKRSRESSPE